MPPETHPPSTGSSASWLGIDRKVARATWTIAVTLLLVGAVYAIRGTLFVFVLALLFAYLLSPLVDQIGERFSPRSRGPALAAAYILVLGVLVAVTIGIGAKVVEETKQLIAKPPDVKAFLTRLQLDHPALAPEIEAAQGRILQELGALVAAVPRLSVEVLAASANLLYLVVIPILSFFMLKDGKQIRDNLLAGFRAGESRSEARRLFTAVHLLLLSYMRALLLLCCTVFVVFSLFLSIMGVQYALLLSSIAFLCEFVPLVGPVTAAGLILVVSALSGYPHVWWIAAFLGAFRLVQDYFVSPRLMGKGVELHPMLVIFGVFAGAEIAGAAGVFLSVPLLALLRLVFAEATQLAK